MSEARAGTGIPRHLRILLGTGLAVAILLVVSVVETLHAQSALSGNSGSGPTAGFFVPKSDKPVEFSLPLLNTAQGRADVKMSQELGLPLVINMWSTTCTVCVQETPAIVAVAKALEGRVRFIGIDTNDSRGAGMAFVKRYGAKYQQLFDPGASVLLGYDLADLPDTVFVTPQGKVVGENLGALTTKSLRQDLQRLFGV